MPTALEVSNRALSLLGEGAVPDLVTPNNKRITACVLHLPRAKAEVLSTMDWGFARDTALLTAATAPTFTFKFAHNLPADSNRLVKLYTAPAADSAYHLWKPITGKFALGNGKVRSNYEHLAAEYIADPDFAVWPPAAQAAVARLLASYLALPVTGDAPKADPHFSIYRRLELPAAQYQDATQFASNENHDDLADIQNSYLYRARFAGLSDPFLSDPL